MQTYGEQCGSPHCGSPQLIEKRISDNGLAPSAPQFLAAAWRLAAIIAAGYLANILGLTDLIPLVPIFLVYAALETRIEDLEGDKQMLQEHVEELEQRLEMRTDAL
jgi:hypothetical protein